MPASEIVIAEKGSQARDIQRAVGNRYGDVHAAEGHLLGLAEPADVNPRWKRWGTELLRPDDGRWPMAPATSPSRRRKLRAIRDALRSAKRVWIATDADREGQLIGQEILEYLKFRGEVMRVLFVAQDADSIRAAFEAARPNSEQADLYAAAEARREADHVCNLSLTRAATVTLRADGNGVIGVGRVRTPTLGIVCRRELEIRAFESTVYWTVRADCTTATGARLSLVHEPEERILDGKVAEGIAFAAVGQSGPLQVETARKREAPPRLLDLPALQQACSRRFGWSATKTLDIAQALYDGDGRKILTYPRAETRYLPESATRDFLAIVAGLRRAGVRAWSSLPVPDQPIVRRGKGGAFWDRGLEGCSHHAIVLNVRRIGELPAILKRLTDDERRMLDLVARVCLAAVMEDHEYDRTDVALTVDGRVYAAQGRQVIEAGWTAALPPARPQAGKGKADEEGQARLPELGAGETATVTEAQAERRETKPPRRYTEGTLIGAMQNAWRFVADPALRSRLKEAKGIGTPATRAEIIAGLRKQGMLATKGKALVPTDAGLELHELLVTADPALADPVRTAEMEQLLDEVATGAAQADRVIEAISTATEMSIRRLLRRAEERPARALAKGSAKKGARKPRANGRGKPDMSAPTAKMVAFARGLAKRKGLRLPAGFQTDSAVCRAFLDEHSGR